jgi:hypothetical protein
MKNPGNSSLFDTIITEARKKEIDPEKLATLLMELREVAKVKEDPLVVKLLRMAAEHLRNNGNFELADRFEDGLPDDVSNLEYFIDLVADSENKFNREELQEFKAALAKG